MQKNLSELAKHMSATEPTVWGATVGICAKKLAVMAVSAARRGMRDGISPDGTPYKPLAHPRPNGGDKPLRDKGLMAASLSASVTEGGLRLAASSPGANLHQYGGTVKAAPGKMLAIPLTREAKRVGSPRKNNFPRKLWVFSSPRNKFLVETKGKGSKKQLVFHYILKDSVTVPARPFVGFSAATMSAMMEVLYESFTKQLITVLKAEPLATS